MILLLIGGIAGAQESVPPKIQSALYTFHPTMEDVSWEFREGFPAATFQGRSGLTTVLFNEDGEWVEKRIRISAHLLPGAVRAYIRERNEDAHISYAARVLQPDDRDTVYRIESELPSEMLLQLLSKNGELLEEERISVQAPPF